MEHLEDELLRRAARHVAHEIRMLQEAWKRHARDRMAWTAWFVHARNLMDFFDPDCKCTERHDDMCARHYLPAEPGRKNWSDLHAQLDPPANCDKYREAVNKLAAHLTYRRVKLAETAERDRGYEPSYEMTEYLLGLAALFMRELPRDRVVWFASLGMM